jgi:hypothetical protein
VSAHIKMMLGALSLARRNTSRTMRGPCDTNKFNNKMPGSSTAKSRKHPLPLSCRAQHVDSSTLGRLVPHTALANTMAYSVAALAAKHSSGAHLP